MYVSGYAHYHSVSRKQPLALGQNGRQAGRECSTSLGDGKPGPVPVQSSFDMLFAYRLCLVPLGKVLLVLGVFGQTKNF